MDISIILVLPLGALIAFGALVGTALAGRARPRLIWPLAVTTLVALPVFLRMPTASELGLWLFAFLALAFWAAIGTLIGAMLARMVLAAVR